MKKYFWIAITAIVLVSCNEAQKTAFINNKEVISEYKVMKAAQEKWTKKNDEVRAGLEEKAKQFQLEVQGYQSIANSLSADNRQKQEQSLMAKQQQLQQEQQMKLQEIQQGSQEEIDTIVSQVKTFIKEYGKKNGYTYIYGDTEVSNILYGKEELDITDKIIEALNKDTSTIAAKEEEKEEKEDETTTKAADTTATE